MRGKLKAYYRLTKPGIVYGNAITATAGFMLASRGHINIMTGIAMVLGLSLVIASACTINNYLDRDIDAEMDRTRRRALVSGVISGKAALVFAIVLAILGLLLLAGFTTWCAATIALFGLITYTAVYTPSKRKTAYSTIIGSIPGAVPPVVGYTAVTGRLDLAAGLLFAFLASWQIPHFYAIGIMRINDYRAAGLPIWPITRGVPSTKRQMLVYIVAFTAAAALLTLLGYTSPLFMVLALILCARWIWLGWQGQSTHEDKIWARAMFKRSLGVLIGLSLWMIVFHV